MYTTEKWTVVGQIINGKHESHELWATMDDAGYPVAFGDKAFTRRYAKELNSRTTYMHGKKGESNGRIHVSSL